MSRLLFALLIGLAMLSAPLAIQGGGAMAMAPANDHHAQKSDGGHCDPAPAGDSSGKSADESNCVAMCTAIALAPAPFVEPSAIRAPVARPTPARFHHGYLAELPTPPPRLS